LHLKFLQTKSYQNEQQRSDSEWKASHEAAVAAAMDVGGRVGSSVGQLVLGRLVHDSVLI